MAKKKKGGKGEVLVVQSKMKDFVRSKGCNVSSDVMSGLNERIQTVLTEAVARCKSNGRKTLRAADL